MAKTLYLMMGYPGAGKTTVSKLICEITGATHLWADFERRKRFASPKHTHKENIELYDELNQVTKDLLLSGKSVVYDTSFSFYKDRQKMREISKKQRANCVLIWVTTPKDVAKKRATNNSDDKSTRVFGDMPEADFDRMSDNLEPPKNDEQHIDISGQNVTLDSVKKALES